MGEGAAEVGAVDVVALFLGDVDLLAAGAVYLNPRCADLLAHADGQGWLAIAEHSGTDPEGCFAELFPHDSEALGCDDVPGVDETVDVGGLLVDGQIPA